MNPVSCADENLDPAVTWYMLYKRNLCPVCMKSHIFSSFYCLSKVRTWHSLTCLVSEDRRQVVGWLHCVQDLMLLPHTLTTTLHHMYSDVELRSRTKKKMLLCVHLSGRVSLSEQLCFFSCPQTLILPASPLSNHKLGLDSSKVLFIFIHRVVLTDLWFWIWVCVISDNKTDLPQLRLCRKLEMVRDLQILVQWLLWCWLWNPTLG